MAGVLILHHMHSIILLQRSALLCSARGDEGWGLEGGGEIKKRGRDRERKVDISEEKEREREDDSLMMSCFPLVRRARGASVPRGNS